MTDEFKGDVHHTSHEFASLTIFKKWKEEEESLTCTSFAQPKGEALSSGGYAFVCNKELILFCMHYLFRSELPVIPLCLLSRWYPQREQTTSKNTSYPKNK